MDMSQYLDTFLEEAREHLNRLEKGLLSLESDPGNSDVLADIFRSAHTLKGMSATMGFDSVAELTHEMENVLQKLRSGETKPSTAIVDMVFKCVDALNTMICNIAEGGNGELRVDHLVAALRTSELPLSTFDENETQQRHNQPITTVELNEFEKSLVKEAINQGYQCFHLVVNINHRCIMKSARAYMVFKNMELVGEIIKTIPSVQDIEEERFDTSFEIVLISTENPDIIREGIVNLSEMDEPEINCITELVSVLPSDPGHNTMAGGEPALPQQDSKTETFKGSVNMNPKTNAAQTVRVDKSKLDSLMNLVGELVINKTRLEQINRLHHLPDLAETLEQMDRTTSDLQNVIMKVRMVPIDHVFNRFPRMVRDLARELGKEIELVIEGEDTELDRTVIDEIGDPLVHLLRNAVDHGIEAPGSRIASGKIECGHIHLMARHEGNNVIIEVEDDGKGINYEALKIKAVSQGMISEEEAAEMNRQSALRLVLLPGLTTVETVTDISGRGVGLDAVLNKIEALNGNLQIESTPGRGAKFKIQLPLTLAIIQALLVSLENEVYAIPLNFIAETISVWPDQIDCVQEQEFTLLRGEVLPLKRLNKLFEVPDAGIAKDPEINIVVVRKGKKTVGLVVDNFIGQQEIVIKPLGKMIGNIPVVAGATILGNGQVSFIVDIAGLL